MIIQNCLTFSENIVTKYELEWRNKSRRSAYIFTPKPKDMWAKLTGNIKIYKLVAKNLKIKLISIEA